MWFAPKSSQVLRVWHETSLWRSWMDLPEALCLLMAYLSMPSAACVIRRFVRLQGVPETHAGLRGITANLDRRQNQQEEATKTGRKTAAPRLALLLGPHRSPGTLTWKHSPLRVFNKCHLTLGEALAVSPRFGGMRTCSGFGQLAGPISTLAGSIRDFMAVCPPWCFSSASRPTWADSIFSSVAWVAFAHKDIYIFLCMHTCDLCTKKKEINKTFSVSLAAVRRLDYPKTSKTNGSILWFLTLCTKVIIVNEN